MKLSTTFILTFITFVVSLFAYMTYAPKETEHIHYHAGFIVYIDGVKQDYSDYKYMNLTPCTQEESKPTKEEEQIEKAHLHDGVGDVVHVENEDGVWGDLFKNIGVSLPGQPEILKQPIEPNSSVVIAIGQEVENPERVTIEHIKEIEVKSELCGIN